MSRLQLDNLLGVPQPTSGRTTNNAPDRAAPQDDVFDEHLRRARTKATGDDASRPETTDRATGVDEKDHAESRSKKPVDASDEATTEPVAADEDQDDDVETETAEATTDAAAGVATETAVEDGVDETTLEVIDEVVPGVGEKDPDAVATKDQAKASLDEIPPSATEEDAAPAPGPSDESDTPAPESDAMTDGPTTDEPIRQPRASNTEASSNADPPSPAEDGEPSTIESMTEEAAVNGPAVSPDGEGPTKKTTKASNNDDKDATEAVSEKKDPAETALKANVGLTADSVEEKVAAKTVDTDAADPAPKPAPPTGHDVATGPARTMSDAPPAPGATTTSDNGAVSVDRVQFVERIAGAFRAAHQGDGTVRMRLHPAELGSLRLEVSMRDGALTARLQTDTPEARGVLLDHLPALRDRLAQQDIRVERFEVDYQTGSGGGSATGTEDQPFSQDRSDRRSAQAASVESDTPRPSHARQTSRTDAGLQLDVTI